MPVSLIPQTTSATLLIVDDDRSEREGLRSIFESAGHHTIGVPDAPSALRLLHKQMCDLVVLDVELPEVDGIALCRLLRAQPGLTQMPLVVFSATDSEIDTWRVGFAGQLSSEFRAARIRSDRQQS